MCGILKNSGKEQTFHGESVAREHGKDIGLRFFDLIGGNEKKANVGESQAKDNCVSNSDIKGATLQHNKIHDHNRRWREKQQQKPAQGENKQHLNRAVASNKKVEGGIKICARPPSLTDARDTGPPADDDAASKKAATLDDVTSPDIGVGGEHIDTDDANN